MEEPRRPSARSPHADRLSVSGERDRAGLQPLIRKWEIRSGEEQSLPETGQPPRAGAERRFVICLKADL